MKLKSLLRLGVVKLSGNIYQIDYNKLRALLVPSLKEVARVMACEVVERQPDVLSIILYGSAAKSETHEESDIDLLVISEEPLDLTKDEYEISIKHGVPLEITTMTLTEFLAVLHLRSSLLFGILEGYNVLFDRAGVAPLLKASMSAVLKEWRYLEDEGLWLKLKR